MKIKNKNIISEVNGIEIGMIVGDDRVEQFYKRNGKIYVWTRDGEEASEFLVKEDGFYSEYDDELIFSNKEILEWNKNW